MITQPFTVGLCSKTYKPFVPDSKPCHPTRSFMSFDKESVRSDEDRARTEGQEIELPVKALGSTYRSLKSCLKPFLTCLVTLSIPAFYASLMIGDTVLGKDAPFLTIDRSLLTLPFRSQCRCFYMERIANL